MVRREQRLRSGSVGPAVQPATALPGGVTRSASAPPGGVFGARNHRARGLPRELIEGRAPIQADECAAHRPREDGRWGVCPGRRAGAWTGTSAVHPLDRGVDGHVRGSPTRPGRGRARPRFTTLKLPPRGEPLREATGSSVIMVHTRPGGPRLGRVSGNHRVWVQPRTCPSAPRFRSCATGLSQGIQSGSRNCRQDFPAGLGGRFESWEHRSLITRN